MVPPFGLIVESIKSMSSVPGSLTLVRDLLFSVAKRTGLVFALLIVSTRIISHYPDVFGR